MGIELVEHYAKLIDERSQVYIEECTINRKPSYTPQLLESKKKNQTCFLLTHDATKFIGKFLVIRFQIVKIEISKRYQSNLAYEQLIRWRTQFPEAFELKEPSAQLPFLCDKKSFLFRDFLLKENGNVVDFFHTPTNEYDIR